ncbi:MAG: DUF6994 family protein [Candidatus Nanopelagicales bacterium]
MHLPDIEVDFRSDANGKDPDQHSRLLKSAHKYLWSKTLPTGEILDLEELNKPGYLQAKVRGRLFEFASDSIGNSFSFRKGALVQLLAQIDDSVKDEFRKINSTIGGFIIFPKNRVGGKMTINGARGTNRRIEDRFDLTLECIRRHYLGKESPLGDTLARYGEFFALFENFEGYVGFFHLQDLLLENTLDIKFFLEFDGNFVRNPLPENKEQYLKYFENSTQFINRRSIRIHDWIHKQTPSSRFIWSSQDSIQVLRESPRVETAQEES